MKLKDIVWLVKTTYKEWSEDKAARLAAALSYYTVFSLAPLLIIVIAIAGMLWGSQQAAQDQIRAQVASLLGQQGADAINSMIVNARNTGSSIIATIIGIVTLILGATGFFGQLQDSLNTIWEVQPKPGGILQMLRKRLFSFTMILGVGFLLLVSLVIDALLSRLGAIAASALPGSALVWQIINFAVSFAVVTLIFAMIFKVLPDVQIDWGDVWLGAVVTALLFVAGKILLGIYLGNASFASTYGAAGSLVIILVWIYYSAQILFFGAEFTQVHANRFGHALQPENGAEFITEEKRLKQGMPHKDRLIPTPDSKPVPAPIYPSQRQPSASPLSAGRQQVLPEAQPSMVALSAIAATLLGFLTGWLFKGKPRK